MGSLQSRELAKNIRALSLEIIYNARASHIGSVFSCADIIAVLYESVMNYDPYQPDWASRDRFILSKGHACVGVYSCLSLKGFFSKEELNTYGLLNSPFMSHISHKVPGVEFSSGSLGHGLSYSVGIALTLKRKKSSSKVYVILGDGELNEGSNWEAIMFISHYKLSNLTIIIDNNKLQGLGLTDDVIRMGQLELKFKSFGLYVKSVDGHSHDEIFRALSETADKNLPSVIIANTTKGKGVDFMEDSLEWHYKNPNKDQFINAMNQIMQ